jgi:hypothetical protein
MQKAIFEILDDVNKLKTGKEKVAELQKYSSNITLATILKGAFCPSVVWDLPEGYIQYKPFVSVGSETALYSEVRRLYLFMKNNPLPKEKKLLLFVQLLEAINPNDAEILLSIKDKQMLNKSLTKKMVIEAFPGLIEEN